MGWQSGKGVSGDLGVSGGGWEGKENDFGITDSDIDGGESGIA